MLAGYDREWVDAGDRREAYYNNIPPGHYTFHVSAANNDGVWNPEGASQAVVSRRISTKRDGSTRWRSAWPGWPCSAVISCGWQRSRAASSSSRRSSISARWHYGASGPFFGRSSI